MGVMVQNKVALFYGSLCILHVYSI